MEYRMYTRKFLRLRTKEPLSGSARIVRFCGKSVQTGTAPVNIHDISSGGLKFTSQLRIPADPSLIIEISMVQDGTLYCMQGYIVRGGKSSKSVYEYGFCFLKQDKGLRNALIKLFSERIHKINRHIIVDPAFPPHDPANG